MNIVNYILGSLVVTTGNFFVVKNYSNSKVNVKNYLIHLLIMAPLIVIINMYITGFVKIITVILSISIALYFSMFNKNFKNALYYTIVYEVFVFLVELIISIVVVSILKFDLSSYNNNFSLSLFLFTVANTIFVYLLSLIKFINKKIVKLSKIMTKNRNEIVYFIFLFALLSLMLFSNKVNLGDSLSFYINTGMMLFVFITLVYILYRDLKNEKLESNYNEMMEYVQKYEKIINEQGKKNHEYNNQLMVIKGYADNKKKLEEYLDLIINEHKCGQNYTIRELSYFPDGGIKGLMYHKLGKMEDNGIKYYIYVDKNIKNIFEDKLDIKTYQDITKLLGVFLDNAIDASKESKTKEIEIDINKEDECIIISITNSFNKNVDTKQIGKKGFTTKGKGHGYGLSIVKDISKHNSNIETIRDIEDDKFKQIIILYYKK